MAVGDATAAQRAAVADSGPVLVYDGVCGLCSASVRFVLRTERDDSLRFVAYQSDVGGELLRAYGMDQDTIDSVVYIADGQAFRRSAAVFAMAGHMRLPWRLVRVFRIVPGWLRDAVYRLIAKTRYRIFGRRPRCSLPAGRRAAAARDRFLGEWVAVDGR
ncbi:MAG: DCC1-like thiol-disulfide oxidoreductase family protein [Planctomycetota bacterium]